jgi:hypothetical protein
MYLLYLKTKFHIDIKQQVKLWLLKRFLQFQMRDQMASSIPRIQYVLNFFENVILIFLEIC